MCECAMQSQAGHKLGVGLSQLFVTATKHLEEQFKEERYILVYAFGGCSPWSAGSIAFSLC